MKCGLSYSYCDITRRAEAGQGQNPHGKRLVPLSDDYVRWMMLRRLQLVPFFQEYWPIPGVPDRLPADFFDMDLNEVIRLTFRSNGQNWEKYLPWLNRLYFRTFGRYYRPLVEIIYRYNNKHRIARYLKNSKCLTKTLYRRYETLETDRGVTARSGMNVSQNLPSP